MDAWDGIWFIRPAVSLPAATALLYLLIFSTTYDHRFLPYIRLLIGIPAGILCLAYAFPKNVRYSVRGMHVQCAVTGVYGLMRIVDMVAVGFWERPEERPRWILQTDTSSTEKKMPQNGSNKHAKHPVLPMPTTLRDRLLYAFDLLISVRGTSILNNRVFDFAQPAVRDFRPPESRWRYVKGYFPTYAFRYLRLDLFDTVSRFHLWDTTSEHPLTSLPFHLQVFYTATIGSTIMNSLPNTNDMTMFVSFALFRAPTKLYAPLCDSPLHATSLADWWANRWHSSFRHMFLRLSLPILRLLPDDTTPRVRKFVRVAMVFWFSAMFHLTQTISLPPDAKHTQLHWYSEGIIKFFMLQPIGIFLESIMIHPVTESFPPTIRLWVRRLFLYCWVLWTGRYFADGWLAMGLLNPGSVWVAFSPIRGLWKGKWLQT